MGNFYFVSQTGTHDNSKHSKQDVESSHKQYLVGGGGPNTSELVPLN